MASTFAQVVSSPEEINRLAAGLDVSYEVICNWRTRGVPAPRAQKVSALTGISLRDLRPDDWRDYWPDAEAQEAA